MVFEQEIAKLFHLDSTLFHVAEDGHTKVYVRIIDMDTAALYLVDYVISVSVDECSRTT